MGQPAQKTLPARDRPSSKQTRARKKATQQEARISRSRPHGSVSSIACAAAAAKPLERSKNARAGHSASPGLANAPALAVSIARRGCGNDSLTPYVAPGQTAVTGLPDAASVTSNLISLSWLGLPCWPYAFCGCAAQPKPSCLG